jgi:hypothetical protein
MKDTGAAELHGLLDDLDAAAAGAAEGRLALGALLSAIGARGFGPVLVALSAAIILPTGMIPFVPHLVAVLIGFVALELALGSRALRLPARLRAVTLPAGAVAGFVRRARPLAARAGRVLRPRHPGLVATRGAQLLIAGVLFTIALFLFAVGLIPGLPFLLCVPVLLIGLGLTTRDGVVAAAGMMLVLMPMGAILSWTAGIVTGEVDVVMRGGTVDLVPGGDD